MTIIIEINNGQTIPLIWFLFYSLIFQNISIRKYCQNIDVWTQANYTCAKILRNTLQIEEVNVTGPRYIIHFSRTPDRNFRCFYPCEFEGVIEKSLLRITEGQIFLSHFHTNNDFFFLFTTKYLILDCQKHSKGPQKILNTLGSDMVT